MLSTPPRGVINWRSLSFGLFGVLFVCGLTPYNDWALNNTFMVGNNLPLAAVMLTFLFSIFINGPLSRWWPKHAFTTGEVAVGFSMMLVSCALPSSGLLRYLPPQLVVPYSLAPGNGDYRALLDAFPLPPWLLPSYEKTSALERAMDPITRGYVGRWTDDSTPPYAAWIRPILTWGVFLFALFGALMLMTGLVRRQWFENERLAFPLAQIELALIEQPRPGRMFSDLLSSRGFWIAFAAIFLVRVWNGLYFYWPREIAQVPLEYDFKMLLTDAPWSYLDDHVKSASLFFSVVGATYFVSGPVAFSLWVMYLLYNVWRMIQGAATGESYVSGLSDQTFGGCIAFALVVVWIGRNHWRLILAQAFRGERPGEPVGRYLSYRWGLFALIGCVLVMIGWLLLAGCSLFGATVIVLVLLLAAMTITRIIAETGLIHGSVGISTMRPWTMLQQAGIAHPVPTGTFVMAATLQATFYDYREVLPVYASHGIKLLDGSVFDDRSNTSDRQSDRSTGRELFAVLFFCVVLGYFVGWASGLVTEYHFAETQDISATVPINGWATGDNVKRQLLDTSVKYATGVYRTGHNPAYHFGGGFLATLLLGMLRLRFAWWPLHPVGFLMLGSYGPLSVLWFSILLGWIVKTLILRFGGSQLYQSCKPFFLGLIVGESASAGFWLVTSIVLNAMNVPYKPISVMPG